MACANLQDKVNGTRLSRLLVDKGTEAMSQTFDKIHPPATLAAVLKVHQKQLQKLRYKVITNLQWDLLYPASGNPDSKNYDITLLTILLRNICRLPSPVTGWNTMPPVADRSIEANITRIKLFRNEVYAHVSSTEVEDAQFENLWQSISQALVDLGIPRHEINELKNCPLSPEEEMYLQKLRDWKLREDECKEVLDEICSKMEDLRVLVSNFQTSGQKGKSDDECNEMQALRQVAEETQRGMKESQSSECDIQKELEAMKVFMAKHFQDPGQRGKSDNEFLQQLSKHNFQGEIRKSVNLFHEGTREWLFKQMDGWFADEESRVMILTAGPGIGKSVFAGKVCQVYKETGKLAACHFCKFNDSNLRNPLKMLQSLASQMCTSINGFKEKLVEKLKRPHEVNTITDAFRVYLNEPLQELETSQPMLIVIDGLDESEANGRSELLDLIAEEFSKLPEWIKILVTSRPGIPVKEKLSHLNPVEILPGDKDNELDLQQYLEFCLPSLPNKSTTIPLLVKKCEGSFLFAFHVQSELLKRGNLEDLAADEMEKFLPKGIGSVYQKYVHRLQNELKTVDVNLDVFNFLKVLVAARGPLPLKFLCKALGMSSDSRAMREMLRKVNESLSSLLYVCDDHVTVFHKSLVDWLTSNNFGEHWYTVQGNDGEELLWHACKAEFENIAKSDLSSNLTLTNEMKYSLSYGSSHLLFVDEKRRDDNDYKWLVDVVIIHFLHFVIRCRLYRDLLEAWEEIVTRNLCTSLKLERKISWHLSQMVKWSSTIIPSYLHAVVNTAPPGYCFDEDDKRKAKLLLHRFVWWEILYPSCDQDSPSSSPVTAVPVVSGTFSPDGSHLACFKSDGTVRIWNAHHCQIVQRFSLHKNFPDVSQWSKRYLWLLYSSNTSSAPILSKYPVDNHLKIKVAEPRHHPINCAVEKILTSSEDVIIFACPNGSVNILDVNNNELKPFRLSTSSQSQPTECASVSRSGSYIFTCGGEEFQIWEKCSNDAPGYKMSVSYNDLLGYSKRKSIIDNDYREISCLACCINSDEKLGVIVSKVRFPTHYFIIVVDIRSGDIICWMFYLNVVETLVQDCFAISSIFVISTGTSAHSRITVNLMNIEIGKDPDTKYLPYPLPTFETNHLFFSFESNILATPSENGSVSFMKIHVPKKLEIA